MNLEEEFQPSRGKYGIIGRRGKHYSMGRSWAKIDIDDSLAMYFESQYRCGPCRIYTMDFGFSDYENRIASLDYFFSVQHEAQDADAIERNFLYDFVYLTKDQIPLYAYPEFNPYRVHLPFPLKGDDRKYFRWHNDMDLFSDMCRVWISIQEKQDGPIVESAASKLLKAIQEGAIRDCYGFSGYLNYLILYGRPLSEDSNKLPFRMYPQDLLDFLR